MTWIDRLTPKNTEEIKSGLFVQKKGDNYNVIHPAAWNGKINWKNLIIGPNFWRGFIFFIILMMIVSSYYIETRACRGFQENPCRNIMNLTRYCLEQSEKIGPNLGVTNEREKDTNSIQGFS